VAVTIETRENLQRREGDHHQLAQVFTNLIANAGGLDGKGRVAITAVPSVIDDDQFAGIHPPTPVIMVDVRTTGPACRPMPRTSTDPFLRPPRVQASTGDCP
jgi:hypothetical protein